jgi:hypothetical protein
MKAGHVMPAKIAPIQKVQSQLMTDMKPETGGPRIGPKVVAAYKMINKIRVISYSACPHHEESHAPPTTDGIVPDIRTYAANNANRTTSSYSYEKTKDDKCGEVWRNC